MARHVVKSVNLSSATGNLHPDSQRSMLMQRLWRLPCVPYSHLKQETFGARLAPEQCGLGVLTIHAVFGCVCLQEEARILEEISHMGTVNPIRDIRAPTTTAAPVRASPTKQLQQRSSSVSHNSTC